MEDKHLSSAGNYTDESIRTMEGMKHIRLRPGMYIRWIGKWASNYTMPSLSFSHLLEIRNVEERCSSKDSISLQPLLMNVAKDMVFGPCFSDGQE